MIEQCSLRVLEEAINRYIDLSDDHREQLEKFDQKTVKLIIKPINYYFFFCFKDHRIHVEAEIEGAADTTISGTPLGFVKMGLLPANELRSLFGHSVELTGDVELGQDIKQFFEAMDIDWEAHLARFSNDFIAQQVTQGLRQGKLWGQGLYRSLTHSISDFLQYDSQALPQRESVDTFCHQVDELGLRVDRLEARIHQSLRQKKPS